MNESSSRCRSRSALCGLWSLEVNVARNGELISTYYMQYAYIYVFFIYSFYAKAKATSGANKKYDARRDDDDDPVAETKNCSIHSDAEHNIYSK